MLSDLRLALRQLRKSPGFTLVAILIAALGIGSATAMFSTVNALVLRPIALPEPDRLAVVYETHLERNIPQFSVSVPNYLDWRQRSRSWESLAAVDTRSMNFTDEAEPELVRAPAVTANFLTTLGVQPALGRNFLATEEGPASPKVALVSETFWQRRLGGKADILGRTVRLDGTAYTIVGVVPAQAPLPIEFDLLTVFDLDPAREERMNHYIDVFGRLAPGITLAQADAEMKTLAAQIFAELPGEERGWSTTIVSLEREIVGDTVRRGLYVLLGAVGLLLLIACANLSNLLLVRATARAHELAVRTALGASRWQVVRQLVTESLLVSTLGGGAGLLFAWWAIDALRSLPLPRAAEISTDPRVLVVACIATVLSGIFAGVGPALNALRAIPQDALRSRGPRSGQRSRLRDGMVVAQIALSLMLLIGAALLARSFWRLLQVQPGFNPAQVLTLALRPTANRMQVFDAVQREVGALPGVTHVGSISRLPLTFGNTQNNIRPVGPSLLAPGQEVQASWRLIDGDYFGAMQIPLLRGRDFRSLNPAEARNSMVISAALARALWGDADPIGRQIERAGGTFTVIGVAGDVRAQQLGQEAMPVFYMSLNRFMFGWQTLVVRTEGDPAALSATVRATIRRAAPAVPVFELRTMDEVRAASLQRERLLMALLGGFAGAALLLAALGTYGVVTFTVQQRTAEIGTRLAIGAQPGDIFRLVVGQGAKLAALGMALGLLGGLAGARVLGTLLYATPGTDVLSYLAAVGALALAALAACLIPARRATQVDPLVALRSE